MGKVARTPGAEAAGRVPACAGCQGPPPGPSPRLPLGWKRVGADAFCKGCFRSRFAVRAVTLPATQVSPETRAKLLACWRRATDAANWCVQQLYRRDTPGLAAAPDCVKPGRAEAGRFYGYGLAAAEPWFADWAGAKQSLNICLQYGHREYLRRRWAVMVRGDQSLLTVRFPFPLPVDADAWRPSYAAGGFPEVTLALPGDAAATTFRLKRAAEFGRQLAGFKALHDGTALKGEAAVYRNRKGDVLVKLVGFFPRRPPGERVHACLLHTDPAALLVAEIDGRSPWILNADHLRRAAAMAATNARRDAERDARRAAGRPAKGHLGGGPADPASVPVMQAKHAAYRQRVGEDAKREKRMDRRQRAALNGSRAARCAKADARAATAVKQAAAQAVRFCVRQKVGTVAYDDAVRTYIAGGFRWHRLRCELARGFAAAGIDFLAAPEAAPYGPASGAAVNEFPGSARDDGGDDGEPLSASAERSRNGRRGRGAPNRSRNAPKTGQRDGVSPGAAELSKVSTA